MPLTSPNLDDRTFQQLLQDCVVRVKKSCPQWTDLSPGDPGMVLLELFAFLTETMIYRLNRVPEKAYVEFLRLLGVTLLPPAAARTQLLFRLRSSRSNPVTIPQGTRVTAARASAAKELPVFVTLREGQVESTEGTLVAACHAEWVQAELAGKGTGLPGLTLTAKRPPIIAPLGEGLDLVVGVEALPGEIDARAPARTFDGKTFRIWREVEGFSDISGDRFAYVADRALGLISFAPALYAKEADDQLARQPNALAEVPPAGREVRLWYLRGGGPEGDLSAGALTVLKDPIPGVEVTNLEAAAGGSAAEPLANALARGPMELHTLHRAVTARDFEVIALRHSGAVARARAFTKAALWKHAAPGTVELLLVPAFPRLAESGWKVTPAQLKERETEDARQQIQNILDARRPLGTVCLVNWVKYKSVRVKARIVCHREEKPDEVKERVSRRLYQTINPLPAIPGSGGWRYGQSLRQFHVFDIILAEPGVKYVDQVRLLLDDVPNRDITALVADACQHRVWHAASGGRLFRSVNDGEGWEQTVSFPDEKIIVLRVHPDLPGCISLATQSLEGSTVSRVRISEDCGESWRLAAQMPNSIDDLAWIVRSGTPSLLMATEVGLYELGDETGAVPIQVIVDAQKQNRGFFAVAVSTDFRGKTNVAVASRANEGIWLSMENGLPHTFEFIGLKGENIRVLEVQEDSAWRFLWAGAASPGFEEGHGCFRWNLNNPAEHWVNYNKGWAGGSCLGLTFFGANVLAATAHAGVLWTDSTKDPTQVSWHRPDVNCGLPLKAVDQFDPVEAVAADGIGRWLMAGGATGIYRSSDGGKTCQSCSGGEFIDKVSLPDTWLFCSGQHAIETVSEDEAGGN